MLNHPDALTRLRYVVHRLRAPGGCPWDMEQTHESLIPHVIEEAYEVADAIAQRDFAALPDELGDLLFQVVYHARMAEEAGHFAFKDVAKAIADVTSWTAPAASGRAATSPSGRARTSRTATKATWA